MTRAPLPLAERYERKIKREPGCWIWQGASINNGGYPQIRVGRKGPIYLVHRVSWEIHRGPIPPGKLVLHTCDNPMCSNPDHLYIGTHADNSRDCRERGRRAKAYKPHTRQRSLTDDQVRLIRADNQPAHVLAYELGVNAATIYSVKARRRKVLVPD